MVCLAWSGSVRAGDSTNRPASWAQPVTVAGIQNCYRLTTNFYRGPQPPAEGMKHLQARGIKTGISLRYLHPDKDVVAGTGLKSVRLKVKPWDRHEAVGGMFLQA